MFRTFDMILIALMVAAAAFTYQTKHGTETVKRDIRRLEAQIHYEEDTIALMKADWSLLVQPIRLQKMAETYAGQLNLEQASPGQVGAVADIPERIADPSAQDDGLTEALAITGKDKVKTGSVKK